MNVLRSMSRGNINPGLFSFVILSLVFFFPLFGEESSGELDVDALQNEISGEAPGELLNFDLGDAAVSLIMRGRWKGTLEGSWGMSLTPLGAAALSGETPFFTQEGDISLSLWLIDRWFVEANFMDDSDLNTYRTGYRGKEGETVQYVGLGNRGLDFPSFPYLDLGGDSPSSFGAYGHFAAGNLAVHTLFRYDAAAREERTFVGNRERTFSFADLSRPQRGTSFVLPDTNITPEVYIQDGRGNWRLLEPTEYGVSARYGLLELTLGTYTAGVLEPEGKVAVYYPGGYSLGTYDGNDDSFLADVQSHFGGIDLRNYAQPGQRSAALGSGANVPGTEIINEKHALVIYENGTFSPFERMNRYLAPVSTSSEAVLVKLSTGETVPGYNLVPLDSTGLDAALQNPDAATARRGLYELLWDAPRESRSPKERWPLGAEYPDIYLPGRTIFTEDFGIRFTNYSAAGDFSLGTDIVSGSVQVYRNGILDPNFTYSVSAGTVSLSNPAGFNEVIRISYLKKTSETRLGSLAAGIGAVWENSGPFSAKLGLGLRWNVSSGAFSEKDASSPGTVGLGAEAKWETESLKAAVTLGLGFVQPDTTGLYRAAGMEGNETVISLPADTSFISETPASLYGVTDILEKRTELVYRDYKETSIIGTSSLADISASKPVVSGETGPYPATDKTLASDVLVAEFEFGSGKTWTGFETPLGIDSEFLERTGKLEVPYRFSGFSREVSPGEFSVRLQIGALAEEGALMTENPDLQIDLPLYGTDVNASDPNNKNNPQSFSVNARIAVFFLTDKQRSRLQGAKYLRLLVERRGDSEDLLGRVILAPPISWGAAWRPVRVNNTGTSPVIEASREFSDSGPQINTHEIIDTALELKHGEILEKLHSNNSRQRALEISWKGLSSGAYSGFGPGVDGRIPAIPLSNYRSLSFFARMPEALDGSRNGDFTGAVLRFILAREPASLGKPDEIALDAGISLEDFISAGVKAGEWARIDLIYQGENCRVLVEGKTASSSSVKYRPHANIGQDGEKSSYAAFLLCPDTSPLPDGNMAVDEIILEDPIPSYRVNNGVSVDWSRPGALLSINDRAVISDVSFQAAVESAAQGNPFEHFEQSADGGEKADALDSGGSFGMNGRGRAGLTLLGFTLAGNYAYSFNSSAGASSGYAWSAGHEISRSFGPFSLRETFDDSPRDRTMNHKLSFALDTKVRGGISGESIYENGKRLRRWQAVTGGKPSERFPLDFSLEASAGTTEKQDRDDKFNYAGTWLESLESLLPDSGRGAESRDAKGSLRFKLDTSPLGMELFFQGASLFSGIRDMAAASSLARIDIPVNPGTVNLLFRAEREYRQDVSGNSKDFGKDGEMWAEGFDTALPLLFAVPVYSLFDPKAGGHMKGFSFSPELCQFADRLELSLQNAVFYGLQSLFLPYRFSFQLGRILEQKLDTPRDTLHLNALLGFSSINMFGAMGVYPLFRFYLGDEFSHTIETSFSFPKDEIVSWGIRSEASMLFFGAAGSEFSLDNTFSYTSRARIGESGRWTESLGAAWTVPAEKTLLGTLYSAFTRVASTQNSWLILANIAKAEYEQLRKETLEFVFEKIPDLTEGDYFRFSVIAGHESMIRIFGRLNLSVFAKLKISEDLNTGIFSFLGSVGTTLNLMF